MRAEYVTHMGDDQLVATAARASFDKLAEMYSPEDNAQLIRFLARGMRATEWADLLAAIPSMAPAQLNAALGQLRRTPRHWAPFAHPHITLRMAAPVPIRTQCFKHKQGLVESEESRRYIKSRPELYVPDVLRMAPTGDVKQGSAGVHPLSTALLRTYTQTCEHAIDVYMGMIEAGVCPEQARFVLPQGVEVHWVWTGSLYAFANFCIQRGADSHAQEEAKQLAASAAAIIEPLFPVSWAALTRGDA